MKFLLIAFALVGIAAAALPDSATQGPNPQDIATPEPEYIDIDLPEPPTPIHRGFPASGPVLRSFSAPVQKPFSISAPVQRAFSISAPAQRQFIAPRPVPQPIVASHSASAFQHRQPQTQHVSGHFYNTLNGYQYRRPSFVRRSYYHRLF